MIKELTNEATELLKKLISTPSLSREEENAAAHIRQFLEAKNIPFSIQGNNTWAKSQVWDDSRPTLLLNSHIDTVKPVSGWTEDPFKAKTKEDRLYGLGSNDAGGPLVSLLATFIHLNKQENLGFNLIFSATAEEEISGTNGIASILNELGKIDLAIVGEPTQMNLAIAEKGLMVMDCAASGKAGHAARNEGENALYKAVRDIQKIIDFQFPKESELLGPVKVTATQIEAGTQHNVIPDVCKFVLDIRTNEKYSNQEIADTINNLIESEAIPRSTRLNSSGISLYHPIVVRAKELEIKCFGSPTLSDQALMPFPSVKIGPGDSARSHTANEYICFSEIENAIDLYIQLLQPLQI